MIGASYLISVPHFLICEMEIKAPTLHNYCEIKNGKAQKVLRRVSLYILIITY